MNLAAAGIVAALAVLISIGAYLYLGQEEPLTMSFNVSISQKSISPGQNAQATFTVTTNKAAPAAINYSIVSRQGRIISTDRQSFLSDGPTQRTAMIHIPIGTQPGPYWLRARAQSGQVFSIALASIAIVNPPAAKPKPLTPSIALKNITNATLITQNATSKPANITPPIPAVPTPTIQTNQTDTLSPGPAPLSPDETIQNARTLASTDPITAADTCKQLTPSDMDSCYTEVALAAKSGTAPLQAGPICQRITDLPSRDACLANLALAGDFTVCDMITNTDIKDSCNALRGKQP